MQGVYLALALLMGGGLVLFGVGAGNGFGGILNAFTGSGSGSAAKQTVSAQEKAALKATAQRPNDPQAWAQLVQARYEAAGQGNNYDPNTSNYTASGIKELGLATDAWQRYTQLTPHPSADLAVLAARAYDATGKFASEVKTWQIVTAANPSAATYFEYLAVAAYRDKQVRIGDLAAAKAISLTPKLQQFQLRQQFNQLKAQTNPGSTSAATSGSSAQTVPINPPPKSTTPKRK